MNCKLNKIATLLAVGFVLVFGQLPAAKWVEAQEIVSVDSSHLSLEVRRGELLRLSRPATTVFVSDPSIADVQVKSPRLIYVFAKQPGDTTLFAVDGNENILANVDIQVTHNLSRLQQTIHELYPDADVVARSMDGTIVLEGYVESASIVENLYRMALEMTGEPEKVLMRVGVTAPNQINLRVRVAEVSRDIDKQIGFNWSLAGTGGGITLGMLVSNPLASSLTQNTFSLGGALGAFDINAVLDALEDEGMISILAEPNLTAMSGETASFLAGGEFPILVPGDDGPTIEFKKFGISLAFTPTLIGTDRVNLHVNPEVSQLSNTNSVSLGGYEIPSLTTRRAETTVELGSGQSFAIAGLIQNNTTHDISKFPGLGDIPVLGALFRSDRFQREESELVLIVTPYLVKPVTARKLSTPVDEYNPPNDEERLLNSGTHVQADSAGQPVTIDGRGSSLIGPVGFVVDE